jgi:thiol-disulfide isomerase/thioredoxin
MEKFAIIFLILIFTLATAKKEQFYKFNVDNIEEYKIEEFKNNVLNSNRVTIIEFYADWCGSSKKFRPFWREFANDTKLWHNRVLRVAALDCVFEDEWVNEICDANDVNDYPQFKFYSIRTKNIIGLKKESEKSRSEDFMKAAIDFIEKQRHPPKEWPKLSPYK